MAKPPRTRPSEPRASAGAAKQRTAASARPRSRRLRVAVVTGTRAEFGLLRPVMDAVKARKDLQLLVVAGGAHLLPPARTIREVESAYSVAATVPMQRSAQTGRGADAAALGRGVSGFAKAFADLKPDWVVVLGDRIEALAAASAASVAGIAVCHIHGGDRAEGIADEAMRHAITKLAHLHCAATKLSANRIVRMGERPERVHVTGSPAIDGLDKIKPMSDAEAEELGDPRAVVLLHPSGLPTRDEHAILDGILGEMSWCGFTPTLVLQPNSDPGSECLRQVIRDHQRRYADRTVPASLSVTGRERPHFVYRDHVPRPMFLGLLKRLASRPQNARGGMSGVLIGNSSAGLIEAAAVRLPVVNVGPRQDGREHGTNVLNVPYARSSDWSAGPLEGALLHAALRLRPSGRHPYGDGCAGPRIAALLAQTDPHAAALLRKRNAY